MIYCNRAFRKFMKSFSFGKCDFAILVFKKTSEITGLYGLNQALFDLVLLATSMSQTIGQNTMNTTR